MKKISSVLLASASFFLVATPVLAADVNWTSSTTTPQPWTDGTNWDVGTPTGGQTADISNGGFAYINSAVTFNTLSIGGTSQLRVQTGANLTGGGAITNNSLIVVTTSGAIGLGNAIGGTGSLTTNGSGGALVLTGANTYSGGTMIAGGTLYIGDAGTTGAIVGNVIDNGVLVFNRSDSLTYAGVISGTGSLQKLGAGTLTLTGVSTYALGTSISAGTLALSGSGSIANSTQVTATGTFDISGTTSGTSIKGLNGAGTVALGSKALALTTSNGSFTGVIQDGGIAGGTGGSLTITGAQILAGANTYTGGTTINSGSTLTIGNGTTGSVVGNIVDNGILTFNRSNAVTFAGDISGTGALTKVGSGTVTLTGTNTYTGGTTITAGTLSIGNGGTTGSLGSGTVTNNAALVFNRADDVTVANSISGTGTLTQSGGGRLILTGANSYGATIISGNILQIGNGGTSGTLGSGTVSVSTGSILLINRSDSITVANAVTGNGQLVLVGAGTTILTGANGYGTTTISAGTLQIGSGGTTGTLGSGAVTNNAALVFNRSDAITVAADINGTGTLRQSGTGTVILTGGNSYNGPTTIDSGSTLQLGNGGASGGLGFGSVVNNGTLISNRTDGSGCCEFGMPGDMSGTGNLIVRGATKFSVSGNNTYGGGTTIDAGAIFQIGFGGTVGTAGSGAITNNGSLIFNRSDSFSFSQVISGSGSLSHVGASQLTLSAINTYTGATTISAGTLALSGAGSVATSSSVTATGTFDISGTTSGTSIKGLNGAGIVALGSKNLTITTATGVFTGVIQNGGIAGGTGGSVTIAGSGNSQTLSGANSYTGGTTINSGGTLSIGNGGTTGSVVGNIVNNGTLNFKRSDAVTFAGIVSGTGALIQAGSGTVTSTGVLTLTGVNTHTGRTSINPGTTIALSGSGSVAASAFVRNFGIFDISQTTSGATIQSLELLPASGVLYPGVVSLGSKTLTIANGVSEFDGVIRDGGIGGGTGGKVTILAGTEILAGNNTYTGRTTINSGATLQIGAGGTSGSLGAGTSPVTNNGTLVFNRSDSLTLANVISGTGAVQISSGTIVYGGGFGSVTYTGNTNVASGATLVLTSGIGVLNVGPYSLIVDNGAVIGDSPGPINNLISGTGSFRLRSGQAGFYADNTYTGGTTIDAGTRLSLAGASATNSATGSVVGNILNNGVLNDDHTGYNVTYTGVISGTGSVIFGGNNTLTAAQTYTGVTLQNTGTLILSGAGSIAATSALEMSGFRKGGFDISAITASGTSIGSLASCGNDRVVAVGVTCASGDTTAMAGSTVTLGTKTLTLTNAAGNFLGVISGTGGLTVTAGTETLSGVNTYTGTTTISGGTLALSGSGSIANSSGVVDAGTLDISGTTSGATITTLSGAGAVALGAQTLTLSNAGTTFSGVIKNAGLTTGTGGGLTLTAGGLTLSGASTYTGPTTVSGGTLNVTGSIGSSAVTVASGASLTGAGTVGAITVSGGGILAPGNSVGATGTLSVNGNLALAATAVTNVDVTPTAADKIAVTGTAAIAGTLNAVFASGTYSAATPYTLVNSTGALSGTFSSYNVTGLSSNFNSALSYNANNVLLVLSNTSFASGSTANVNSGTVTVTDNQTTGGLASSTSGGTIALSSGATLTDDQSSNTSFSGTITGAGAFAKAGTGTLILNGANTYTGGTAINGGVLEVGDAANPGASILGPVTVGSGGTLMGHGTINGAVEIGSGGTFNPGGSIGTTTVNSATFASGSTFTVETNAAGQSDKIIATGAVVINNGATLAVAPEAPLASYGRLTNYTILQAAGGVSGTFSSITSTAATLTPVVAYAPNTVTLTLVRPDLLATVATNANQTSIGTAIAASSGSAVLGFLAPQSDAAVRTAFNQLSGDIHASLRSAAVEDSRIIRDTVLDHLGRTSDSMTVWGAGFGGYGSISTDGNASGLHHDTAGFIAGADMPLGDGFRAGLAGAYTSNTASVTGKTSTASGNSGHVVAYGGWSDGRIDLKLGGDFGWGNTRVTRTLAAFGQTNNDRQDQRLAQVFGDAGYKFETSRAMVEPYIGIASISATTGGFTETGGATALSGGSRTDNQTYGTLGLRASLAPMMLTESAGTITPHVDMGWQHAFKTLRPGQVETLASLSQSFTVLGAPLASDAAAVRAGFDLAITPEATLSLDYDGSFASRVQNNAIRGSLAWRF